MHVLQVVTDTDRRGAQVFATDLGPALTRLGWEVRTVALAEGSVGGLDLPVLGPSRRSPRTLWALRRAMGDVDVVAAHGSTTLPACAIAGVGRRPPFVYRQISESRFWADTPARRARVRASLGRAAGVVALWPGAAEVLTSDFGVPAERSTVVPNGVPPSRFPPADGDERVRARRQLGFSPKTPIIAYLGALVPEKGVDVVLRAIGRTSAPATVIVAGEGPERAMLERLAGQVAPGRVQLLGSVDDPRTVLAASDVVVLASRGGDSMPAVLVEAGLVGRPVVATPVEGIVEIVDDGTTGLLVPVDDAAALAQAFDALLADPERRRAMGAAGTRHCRDRYGIDVVAAAWDGVLRAATAPRA